MFFDKHKLGDVLLKAADSHHRSIPRILFLIAVDHDKNNIPS